MGRVRSSLRMKRAETPDGVRAIGFKPIVGKSKANSWQAKQRHLGMPAISVLRGPNNTFGQKLNGASNDPWIAHDTAMAKPGGHLQQGPG